MENYLDKLNPQQRAAVEYTDGPSLVIAGAGSGKTRVLTYKIVHLLHQGYEPWRIMALTFTNKAAREMRQRIQELVGERTASSLWMGTFHSIFLKILRRNADRIGYKPTFTIYDTADSRSLIKSIIREIDLDDKVYKPNTVLSAISSAKNALISPEKYATLQDVLDADRRARRPMIYALYRNYRDRCFAASAMDFDDLLYYTNLLLRDNPDILHHYQEFFRYVLVDEYQDTNFAQHVIVSQICSESHALCVVGDDAQSIYSFRGANLSNILNLRRSYPELATFKLEQNYRSTQTIINAANSLIEKNTRQIPKNVFSKNATGSRIEVVESFSDFEEGYVVANRISQVKMKSHDSYEEFAILYRTNAQSRVLEESLRKRNIPYRIYGGLSFYQRKEVKDALAYFRLTINPADDEALKRIINFPARGIGETTVNKLLRAATDAKVSIWEVISNLELYNPGVNSGTARKLQAFHDLIMSFVELDSTGVNSEEVASLIMNKTGIIAMYHHDRTPENLSKQENLNELLSGVKEFVVNRTEEGSEALSLTDFMSEVSLATDQDSDTASEDGIEERVTLMTAHAAKGLEFNNVFIVGVEEDLFPSAMASGSLQEIEEERRLLYVALTRARNFCMLTYAKTRYRNGQTASCSPSRFLRDIDRQYLKMASGVSFGPSPQREDVYRQSFHSPESVRPAPVEKRDATRWIPAEKSSTAKPSMTGTHTADELTEGMNIEHDRFGRGTITSIDVSRSDARIVVDFDNTGSRVLLLKFARFTIIN